MLKALQRDELTVWIIWKRCTHLSMRINLDGSMDGRLERASESRREDLRLAGPGKCGSAMVPCVLCGRE